MAEGQSVRSSPLLDDQPSEIDRLGFDTYATALEEVILNPQANTPFLIGVFGRWGTGKTTLMRLLERRLKTRKAISVWFSAWLYGGEAEIGAAFLQNLVSQLSARLSLGDKLLFSLGLLSRGLAWERLWLQLPALAFRCVVVLAPAVAGLMVARAVGTNQALGVVLGAMGAGATLVVGWLQLKPLLSSLGKPDIPGASLYRSMDFEKHVGVMERFREQFRRMVGSLPSHSARVVVFIDDLDRCEPDKALQLLDVIKIFLDVPRCVFVLGLDLGVIQKALERKYPQDEAAQREYLSKIIQLPFHLPPPTKAGLATYLEQLDVRFPDQRCGEVFLGAVAQNPREIKRLINTYSLNWYLAQARVGSAVTPVRLAKVIVIQQAYGALFSLLRERPDWLALLERAMRDSVEGVPPGLAGMTRDMGSANSEATVLVSAAGIAVPPAVLPFVDNPRLQALLTLHPQLSPGEDDANFSELGADDIAVYFSLAGQTSSTAAPEGGEAALGDPAGAGTAEYPNFGPRYQVLGRLGTGGIGEVFLAQDIRLGRQVAIKRLHVTLMADSTWAERFRREIRLLERIGAHPNVVQLLDAGVVSGAGGGTPFYVMENSGGGTLADLLNQGPLSEVRLRQILRPMFDALDHVHRAGIIHGDVKPASIVIASTGVPKLIDFGLAFLGEEGRDNLTQVGSVIATMRYASPEQLSGGSIDARADLFSLGVVIYQALTGQTPFAGETAAEMAWRVASGDVAPPSLLNVAIPPAMDRFMSKILAPDPEARFATAAEAGEAFDAALGAERGGATAPPPPT